MREGQAGDLGGALVGEVHRLLAVQVQAYGTADAHVLELLLGMVEQQRGWPPVDVAVRRFVAGEGGDLVREAAQQALHHRHMGLEDGVDLVAGDELGGLLMGRKGHEDHPLHRRQGTESDPGAPPVVAPVEDDAFGGEAGDLERAGADRAVGQVRRQRGETAHVRGRGRGINVLRQDKHALGEAYRHVGEEPARIGVRQLDAQRVVVHPYELPDVAGHGRGVELVALALAVLLQQVEGEDDVIGGEWRCRRSS